MASTMAFNNDAYEFAFDQAERTRVRQLEEEERQRRIADHDETVARKVKAHDVSDAIRRESTTIKARFVKGPSMWQRGRNALTQAPFSAGRILYNAVSAAPATASKYLPTAETVKNTAIAREKAAEQALGGAYDTAKHMLTNAASAAAPAASTAASYIPSFSSMMNTAYAIKDKVMHNIPFVEHPMTLADVKASEEIERQRRIAEDKNSTAIGNARRISQLLRISKDYKPRKAHPSGFHSYTHSIEEAERTRRLANKNSEDARMMLAFKVASAVNQLGWPFIRKAKGNVPSTPAAFLAEEERRRIIGNQPAMLTARYNSNKVASLIKDAFKPRDTGALRSYTRSLEEKERRHRMRYPDASIHSAHRQAELIRNIGGPFYIPTSSLADQVEQLDYAKARAVPAFEPTNARKQARKAAKLANKEQWPKSKKERQVAQEFAQEQPKSIDTKWMEEDERKSRMADRAWQQIAFDNAHKVSSLINKRKGEYKKRIAAYQPDSFVSPYTATISPSSAQVLPLEFIPKTQNTQPAANLAKTTSFAPQPELIPSATSVPVSHQAAFSQPPAPQHAIISQPLQKLPGSPYPTSAQIHNAQANSPAFSTPLSTPIVNYPPQSTYVSFPATSSPAAPTTFYQPSPIATAPAAQVAPITAPVSKPTPISKPVDSVASFPKSIPVTPSSRTASAPNFSAPKSFSQPLDTQSKKQQWTPESQSKLINNVHKLVETEMALADKERQKAASLKNKSGAFGRFRMHRHESAAAKHADNAKRHQEWLRTASPATTAMPAR